MSKQVKNAVTETVSAPNPSSQNRFISVRTFDAQGKTIGERIVDMFHYGTRGWLSNHLWWATSNGHCTEVDLAKPKEIDEYLSKGKEALAAKFNTAPAPETVIEPVAKAA